MVRVSVGEDEEVDLPDVFPQALQPKLRSRVDLDVQAVHDHMDGGAGAAVAGIGGGADGAIATYQGDPLGGAGAEENDFH